MIAFTLSGCSTIEQSASAGAVAGAALGGAIGHQSDNGVAGAALGGLGGAFAGMAWHRKSKPSEFEQGYASGYRDALADVARHQWVQATGQCVQPEVADTNKGLMNERDEE